MAMKLPKDRQLLCICRKIAAVGLALLFWVLFSMILFGWRGYILNYPDSIADTVPSGFPVIVVKHTSSNNGVRTHELVAWEQWKRQRTQGVAYLWIENGTGEGQQDREPNRPFFYTYRMTELGPQRYMVHVNVTDRDDMEMRAQYRVEGDQIIPLTFGIVTGAMMGGGIVPLSLVLTVLFCWSIRRLLRWYTRSTGGEQEIRELLSQARLTLSLLVGYYLFLACQRVFRLIWQRN